MEEPIPALGEHVLPYSARAPCETKRFFTRQRQAHLRWAAQLSLCLTPVNREHAGATVSGRTQRKSLTSLPHFALACRVFIGTGYGHIVAQTRKHHDTSAPPSSLLLTKRSLYLSKRMKKAHCFERHTYTLFLLFPTLQRRSQHNPHGQHKASTQASKQPASHPIRSPLDARDKLVHVSGPTSPPRLLR